MRVNIVGFGLGVCLLQQQAQLPPLAWALLLLPLLILWWTLNLRAAHVRGARIASVSLAIAIFGATGYFYAAAWAQWRLAGRLAPQLSLIHI